jgi:hypothetical protein
MVLTSSGEDEVDSIEQLQEHTASAVERAKQYHIQFRTPKTETMLRWKKAR